MIHKHSRHCPRPLESHPVCPKPLPYEWAWDGSCVPGRTSKANYETFSVGCFQWVPRVDGGLKRGKVVERFSGRTDAPDAVFAQAASWCAAQNARIVRLPQCPFCRQEAIQKTAEHGGYYIKCPSRGKPHAHVAALTVNALHQLWREFVTKNTKETK